MKIYKYNSENIQDVSLTCFCEVAVNYDSLVFINKVTSKVVIKRGNTHIQDLVAEKMNNRDKLSTFIDLLKIWRTDYDLVIDDLCEGGYFE